MLAKVVGEHSHPKSTPTRPHPGSRRRDAISRLIQGFGTGTCPPRSKLERPLPAAGGGDGRQVEET
jgi:hypothetical protein